MSCKMNEEKGTEEGIWRSGSQLVLHVSARLPDRCVKTNRPANGLRLRKKLSWHHPALYLLILLPPHLLLYALVAIFVLRRATVEVGVSQEAMARRKKATLAAWILSLLGIFFVVAGFVVGRLVEEESLVVLSVVGGLLVGGGTLVAGLAFAASDAANVVKPVKISHEYVWLKGVNEAYLAGFPELRSR